MTTLMVQGTTSDAGKSTLVTALCRWLYRQGVAVAPFKPQNMALNSAVTEEGGEIGRAQAVQAQACGLAAQTDMNPVLIKPSSDTGAQIIIHGHSIGHQDAATFHDYKPTALSAVMESHQRLNMAYQIVVVEGAGSPAEINLREGDIANMGFAEAVDCPVILIADIDKGGVFAHLVGTLALLSESEQARVVGFVINRFRGDIALLQSGLDWLEQKTGKPVLGVLPYLHGLHLEAEDAIACEQVELSDSPLRVVVPVLPRISNHTDFDPLRLHPGVDLQFCPPGKVLGRELAACDLLILPGSKNVREDLAWLREQGWEAAINRHLRYGGRVMGLCGGYQMLGEWIDDPLGVEGKAGRTNGLAYLHIQTTLQADKQLHNVTGHLCLDRNLDSDLTDQKPPVTGYEIHVGHSAGPALQRPVMQLSDGPEGAMSEDGQVLGTYVHGLFERSEACEALLHWAATGTRTMDGQSQTSTPVFNYQNLREQQIDRLADSVEKYLDTKRLRQLLRLNPVEEKA